MNTPKTDTTPTEKQGATDAAASQGDPQRGETGPANRGSPAANGMKQFSKTGTERGEGARSGEGAAK